MSGRRPRSASAGSTSAAFATRPTERAVPAASASSHRASASSIAWRFVLEIAQRRGDDRLAPRPPRRRAQRRPRSLTASGCAPPMAPRPAVRTSRPRSEPLKCWREHSASVSYVDWRIPCWPMYSHAPAVYWPNMISPRRLSSWKVSQLAHRPTRCEFGGQHAGRVLVGAEARRPACRIASRASRHVAARAGESTITSKHAPIARRLAGASVDDQLLRPLAVLDRCSPACGGCPLGARRGSGARSTVRGSVAVAWILLRWLARVNRRGSVRCRSRVRGARASACGSMDANGIPGGVWRQG